MQNEIYDAVIVGAGPAGASAAIYLAQAGKRVLLAEARSFPRAKLCGEFISPECLTHFQNLNVAARINATNAARIFETRFTATSGASCRVPSAWFGTSNEGYALGLSRAEMDAQLLARAGEAGVCVAKETTAVAVVVNEKGIVRGVRLRHQVSGEISEAHAQVVIDATGRARAVSRLAAKQTAKTKFATPQASDAKPELTSQLKSSKQIGVTNQSEVSNQSEINKQTEITKRERASLVAFKAHLRLSDESLSACENRACEIFFYPGGYGGLNEIEAGKWNLCFIVKAEDAKACGGGAEKVLREIVFRNSCARTLLQDATIESEWLCVAIERFGRGQVAPFPGLLAVGDAASFIDPFTGSGMLMALDNGLLAARVIKKWLAHNKGDSSLLAYKLLAENYQAAYRKKFDKRLRVCANLRRAAFAPAWLIAATIRTLNLNNSLRRRIARATRGTTVSFAKQKS